jgi:hypothetical protein
LGGRTYCILHKVLKLTSVTLGKQLHTVQWHIQDLPAKW